MLNCICPRPKKGVIAGEQGGRETRPIIGPGVDTAKAPSSEATIVAPTILRKEASVPLERFGALRIALIRPCRQLAWPERRRWSVRILQRSTQHRKTKQKFVCVEVVEVAVAAVDAVASQYENNRK